MPCQNRTIKRMKYWLYHYPSNNKKSEDDVQESIWSLKQKLSCCIQNSEFALFIFVIFIRSLWSCCHSESCITTNCILLENKGLPKLTVYSWFSCLQVNQTLNYKKLFISTRPFTKANISRFGNV